LDIQSGDTHLVATYINETPIIVILKSCPNQSFINKVELFMANISLACAGTTFSRSPMAPQCEDAISGQTRPAVRKMCKSNAAFAAEITESLKPVLDAADLLMSRAHLKGEPVRIVQNPGPEIFEKIREAITKIDPLLATVALDDINSTMLKTYDTFLQKKKKWLIHDSPYCHIIINPDLEHMVPPEILQEIKTYKIPIPQFRKKHDHFAEFKNVFKTAESLKPVVLPEKQGKKPKMKSGCPIRNSSLRTWVTCSACTKPRAVFSVKKFKDPVKTLQLLAELQEDTDWVCSESLIPPHSYQYLQEVGIYTDHRKRCSDMVEASYYSHNSGPLICHTCCSVLSPEDQIKYKRLKNDNKSVIPCCGSLDCMRSAPRYPDGWVLKPKQNRKKRRPSSPGDQRKPAQPGS